MKASPTTNSALIRRFRLQRKRSLEVASEQLGTSTAVLSRLERGIRIPTRNELIHMSRVYELSPWESHSLLVTAGFMPDPPLVRLFADEAPLWEALLQQIPYPAYIMDDSGYVVMWNAQLRALWPLNEAQPTHVIESLYSPEAREVLNDDWRRQALSAIWNYYLYTISMPQVRPNVQVLLDLAEKWGAGFIQLWNEAIGRGLTSAPERMLDQIGIEIVRHLPVGTLRYLVTQVGARPATTNGLFLWLPLDAESLSLHERFVQTTSHKVFRLKSRG